MSSLDAALQRALSVRLNLQISLSQLPIIEEWMDIHLDRWLEHNPMPPEMPSGEQSTYLAMLGSDLRRMWWGAWGDPRGFVPKLADYFKLCNIAKTDAALLDQIGEQLEPAQVGSWIAVWGGKVITGWHFWDRYPWTAIDPLFGEHEAKRKLAKLIAEHQIEHVQRFAQSIGEAPFSELELALPERSVDEQVRLGSAACAQLTGAPLDERVLAQLARAQEPALAISVRIRGGAISRVGVIASKLTLSDAEQLCSAATTPFDPKLAKLIGALGGAPSRVEYGRAGDRAGVDLYVEPNHTAPAKPAEAN
ncbi:MAG: hypothetical protein AB7O24_22450 [Kofleriaceae bacterium]